MKAKFKIERPDDVPMTLTLTMTCGQWKTLQAQLDSAYPSWKLSSMISEMVHQASTTFGKTVEIDS
ncbi:hypothetical protein [Burkholderia gladioli]|uniref:hypothetical protein n=1 Tax=Burkholderia gladioli TaxID=28095 RepID=UPI000F80516E|nr:hypothetical protein [Burkholderia gladioli]MDD1789041.1 hypothetical protein [Burkholderia gladioli]